MAEKEIKGAGVVIYPGTIRFERAFTVSPARLWEYLTRPALMSAWLADADIDVCVGGGVELRLVAEEVPERKKNGATVRGVISRCVPRHVLAYSWNESAVTFELKTDDKEVQLVLTHSGLPEPMVAKCCAGWHAHLDALLAHLCEEKPQAFLPHFERLCKHYKQHATAPVQKERRKLAANGMRPDRRRTPRGNDFV